MKSPLSIAEVGLFLLPLTAAEVAEVEAEESVQDIEIDDGEDAAA